MQDLLLAAAIGAALPTVLLGCWVFREIAAVRRMERRNADLMDRLAAKNLAEYKALTAPAEPPVQVPARDEIVDTTYPVVGPAVG